MANSALRQVSHRREYLHHKVSCDLTIISCSIIQTLNQTIMLLYSLIFRTEPALNLRHLLQHAPHRPFNSISNIFVVTFGRLSYCDSPGWIDPERRQELEILSGGTFIGFDIAKLTTSH